VNTWKSGKVALGPQQRPMKVFCGDRRQKSK